MEINKRFATLLSFLALFCQAGEFTNSIRPAGLIGKFSTGRVSNIAENGLALYTDSKAQSGMGLS